MVNRTLIRGLDKNIEDVVLEEDLLAYYGADAEISLNQLIEGTVVRIEKEFVIVDVGYKSEGAIPVSEWEEDEEAPKPGDKVKVLVEELEDTMTGEDVSARGMIVLSKRKAAKIEAWNDMMQRVKEGDVVDGKVTKKIKGGLLVDIGVNVFLPASQVDVRRPSDISEFIDQTIKCVVLKIDETRRNIVVSRRALIEKDRAEKKTSLLNELEVGQIREGTVKNIAEFGAFIDLGGIDGLLHITDMSWGRIKHPSEMLKVGQELDVMVLEVDQDRERISLGLKQCSENPWVTIAEQYPKGTRVKGKVVNLAAYGAFVEIAPGIEGLVHISEFSWTKRVARASDMLNHGDEVDVEILSIDSENQKIALGIRQTQANPWDSVQDRYPVGGRVKGKVRNFTTYGAFIELEEGIDGMIHVSDMSWTRKINHPSECLEKGKEVEAIILDVNPKEQRISLGLKQASQDPWADIASKYKVGALVKGKVSKIASFGAFIELEDGVDGLVHISQISDQRVDKVKDALQAGQEVEARVVKVDRGERRIGLSIRAVTMTEDELKALEAEAAAEPAEGEASGLGSSESFGGLGAAFDEAFQNVEWQPGEAN